MNLLKYGLIPWIVLAIIAGLFFGQVAGETFVRFFVTFNSIFWAYLGFCIPLIIIGLVSPGISDLGKRAGRLLIITVALAYFFTLFSGFFSYGSCSVIFEKMLDTTVAVQSEAAAGSGDKVNEAANLKPFLNVEIPPLMGVMSALVLAFILGIGTGSVRGETLSNVLSEFRSIIERMISVSIVPFLPLFIFGVFLEMSFNGNAIRTISTYGKVIGVIFVLHIILLLVQFTIGGIVFGKNPLKMLYSMLPAYVTALGTSSSAATIPVSVKCAEKMGVDPDIADFCMPLCATIHLSGSTLKIVATALAICLSDGLPHGLELFGRFICMLGIIMIAAPGVPGGAIIAASGLLSSILEFDERQVALMTSIYIAIDSFGTAGNVTGDGAIAAIVDRISRIGISSRGIPGE